LCSSAQRAVYARHSNVQTMTYASWRNALRRSGDPCIDL
jgi:hypothetical protein